MNEEIQLPVCRDCKEIEKIKTANGQLIADLIGCRDGALVRDLRSEVERLKADLRDERALTDEDYSLIEIENNKLRADANNLKTIFIELDNWVHDYEPPHPMLRRIIVQLSAQLKELKAKG